MSRERLGDWLDAEPRDENGRAGVGRGGLLGEAGDEPREAAWLDADEVEPSDRPRRRRVLLAVATVPWIVLGIILVVGRGEPAGEPDAAASPAPAAPAPAAAGGDLSGPLAAAASLAVHQALSEAHDGRASYADLVHPESASTVGSLTIVRVAALVLDGDDERWHTTRAARYAVALADGPDGLLPVGRPWPVGAIFQPRPLGSDAPGLEQARGQLTWRDSDQDAAAVAQALGLAGFTDVTDVTVRQSPQLDGVVQAQFSGLAAGEPATRSHAVLLAGDPDLRVLGTEQP